MLLNSEGYWLKGESVEDEWGFMYEKGKELVFGKAYPEAWQQIQSKQKGQFKTSQGLFTFSTVYPLLEGQMLNSGSDDALAASIVKFDAKEYNWKIVSHIPTETLYSARNTLLITICAVAGLLIILFSIGSLRLAWNTTKRKQAEKKLENLAKFPSENPNPVLRISKEGVLLYANSASESFLTEWCCKTGQMIPTNWREMVSKAFASGVEKTIETEHAEKIYSFVIAPVTKGDYVNIYGRDITERKHAEETLRQYEHIVSSSTDMLALLDKQYNYLAANKEYLKVFKLSSEQLIGNTAANVFGEELFKTVIKPNADRCLGGEEVNYQDWFDFPACGRRYMDITYYPYCSEDNKIIGFVVNGRNITERRQAEEERDSLAKFPSENPNPVLRIAKEGLLLYANNASQSLLDEWDCKVEQMVPANWGEMVFKAFVSRTEKRIETEHAGKIYSFVIAPVTEGGYVNIYGRDITEQMQAQQEVQNLAKFPSENPNPVLRISKDGTLLYANSASESFLSEWGCKAGQMIPTNWREMVSKAFASGIEKRIETEHAGKIYSFVIAPVTETDYVNIYGRDISERKKAEENLLASEKRFRSVVETAMNTIITADSSGNIVFWNAAAEKMFGYSLDEIRGKPFVTIIPERYWESVFERGSPRIIGETLEYHGLSKAGVEFPIELSFSKWETVEGVFFTTVINDITDRKQTEKLRENWLSILESKNKELEHFSRIIRHDFGNPVLSIEAFSNELGVVSDQLLRLIVEEGMSEKFDGLALSILRDKIPSFIGFIQKSNDEIKSLLNGLRDVATIGRAVISIESLDMNNLIESLAGTMKFQIQDSGATVTVEAIPRCLGDKDMVNHVFSNLLTNALKYLDPNRKGQICIRGRSEGGQSIYCLEDNGIGITPYNQKKVFDIFYRVDPSSSAGGDGVGLSIVCKILQRINGKIWVESERGQGSKFFVSLPNV